MPKSLKSVSASKVREARDASRLTQAVAASLVHTSTANWQNWEQGRYRMVPAVYELFLLKTGQIDFAPDPESFFKTL